MASASLRGTVVMLAMALCLALASASPRGLRQATKPAAKPAAALALPGSNALCVGPTAPAKIRYQWYVVVCGLLMLSRAAPIWAFLAPVPTRTAPLQILRLTPASCSFFGVGRMR